jgi:Protein of unknown function (DUF3634)
VPLVIALLLLAATVPLVIALLRANELFYLRLRGGRIRIARGRVPQRLLDDMADILRDPAPAGGTLRGVSEDGRVQLYEDAGLTDAQKQQLRNVVGGWTVAQVRNAPRPR